MALNSRHMNVLRYLSERRGYVPAENVAGDLGVSRRTVYRDIAAINRFASVIEIAPGKGLRLRADEYQRLITGPAWGASSSISVAGRRRAILVTLLVTSPRRHSIQEFSERFLVAATSIRKDMTFIGEQLLPEGLRLDVSHEGTAILGPERALREALGRLVWPYFSKDLDPQKRGEADAELEELRRHGLFGTTLLEQVREAVARAESSLGIHLQDPYYFNVVTHLVTMVERIRSLPLQEPDRAPILAGSQVVKDFSLGIMRALEASLDTRVPAREIEEFHLLVRGADLEADAADANMAPAGAQAEAFTIALIDRMSALSGIDFGKDERLREQIVFHVGPMLARTESGVTLINPLAEEIASEFAGTFDFVSIAVAGIRQEFCLRSIPDDEVAYLALYFENSMERMRRGLRVCILCSTGRGTSQFLVDRVRKEFPSWIIVNVLPVHRLDHGAQMDKALAEALDGVDLLVSTIGDVAAPVPVVHVSPFLAATDVELLADAERMYSAERAVPVVEYLDLVNGYSDAEAMVSAVASVLAGFGYVEDAEAATAAAMEREALGPTYVGNQTAVPHIVGHCVSRSGVVVVNAPGSNWGEWRVDTAVFLLLRRSAGDPSAEFLQPVIARLVRGIAAGCRISGVDDLREMLGRQASVHRLDS